MKPKRTQRTPRSFIKKVKERKECRVLVLRMQKNAKNATFFYKERKRTQERCILLKRMFAQWSAQEYFIKKPVNCKVPRNFVKFIKIICWPRKYPGLSLSAVNSKELAGLYFFLACLCCMYGT